MATLGVQDFMKVWTQSDETSQLKIQKFLLSAMDKYEEKQSDFVSMWNEGSPVSSQVVRWMREHGYPTNFQAQLTAADTLTFTDSQYLFQSAMTADSIKKVVRVGTILERPSDGTQVKVTSIDALSGGSPWTVTVAEHGNSASGSVSTDSAVVQWDIIGELWSDFDDAAHPRSLDRGFYRVGTQIFAETFEIPKTRENTKYEIVGNETEHQIAALIRKLRRQKASSLLRMLPYYSSSYKYGYDTAEPSMCGLTHFWDVVIGEVENDNTDVHYDASSTEISQEMLSNVAEAMELTEYTDFNVGDWYLVVHPKQNRVINTFEQMYRRTSADSTKVGWTVDEIELDNGKELKILRDRYMPVKQAFICNKDALSYGYYNKDKLDRKRLSTAGRYERWLISFQMYGAVVRSPRANLGHIYGLTDPTA